MGYTIPSDSHGAGDTGHVGDHNNLADMLTLLAGGVAVFNVKNTAYGGGAKFDGATDDTTAIQAALTAASTAGGGIVLCPAGTAIISQTLQIGSATTLMGAGIGATTIRVKASSLSSFTQVGANTGSPMIATIGNAAKSRVTISALTLDGNQANAGTLAGYADAPECAPVGIWSSSLVSIRGIEVINAIGYSIYLQGCSDSDVTGCRVLSGAGSALGTNQQDGIHFTQCSHCRAEDNSIDTGTGSAGDDGIAVQSLGSSSSDIVIAGNMIRAAQSGIHLAIGGAGNITDVTVCGNVIWQAGADGIRLDTSSTGTIGAVAITGNTFRNLPAHAVDIEAQFAGVTVSGNEFDSATNGLANGVYVGHAGANVNIDGNTFTSYGVANGIVIGPTGGGTAITGWSVTGNVIDMSAGAAASIGVLVTDASDGRVCDNTILGSTQASSAGIKVNGVSSAPTGSVITGNRVKGWATGILEVNSGVTPDYNAIAGNNCHGCTAFITQTGTHDVPVAASIGTVNVVA